MGSSYHAAYPERELTFANVSFSINDRGRSWTIDRLSSRQRDKGMDRKVGAKERGDLESKKNYRKTHREGRQRYFESK